MNEPSYTNGRSKRALITGITGQDGSYLARFLLDKGYDVHGIVRRASLFNTDRIDELYHDPHVEGVKLTLHYGDLADGSSLRHVLDKVAPDEVYNLGAQSHVKVSFDIPEYTADVDALGTLRLLESLRDHIRQRGEQDPSLLRGSANDLHEGVGPRCGRDVRCVGRDRPQGPPAEES